MFWPMAQLWWLTWVVTLTKLEYYEIRLTICLYRFEAEAWILPRHILQDHTGGIIWKQWWYLKQVVCPRTNSCMQGVANKIANGDSGRPRPLWGSRAYLPIYWITFYLLLLLLNFITDLLLHTRTGKYYICPNNKQYNKDIVGEIFDKCANGSKVDWKIKSSNTYFSQRCFQLKVFASLKLQADSKYLHASWFYGCLNSTVAGLS